MAFVILGLSIICGLASLICWIITLTKIFPESIGKGIFGIICALYAFIWAWQNKDRAGTTVVYAWTAAILFNILLNIAARTLLS
ncbi:MAG TPA: hypothetical protein VGN88_13675 [Phycisphaerae bacterium]